MSRHKKESRVSWPWVLIVAGYVMVVLILGLLGLSRYHW